MLLEECSICATRCYFPSGGFLSVFAEFEGMGLGRFSPRTADAHVAPGLVLMRQQRNTPNGRCSRIAICERMTEPHPSAGAVYFLTVGGPVGFAGIWGLDRMVITSMFGARTLVTGSFLKRSTSRIYQYDTVI